MGTLNLKRFEVNSEKIPLLGFKGKNNAFIGDTEKVHFDFISAKMDADKRMYIILKEFFMNPIQKWMRKSQFPWKMVLRFVIIILGMFQMSWFAGQRTQYLNQNTELTKALNNMFLKNWEPENSENKNNLYAVYSATEFYEHMEFVVRQFGNINSLNYGRYAYDIDEQNGRPIPLYLCIMEYEGRIDPGKLFIDIKEFPQERCFVVLYPTPTNSSLSEKHFSMTDFLRQSNYSLQFETLVKAKLNFRLRTIVFKSMNEIRQPECYTLNVTIVFDNTNYDGHIPVSKTVTSNRKNCRFNDSDAKQDNLYKTQQPLNMIIIVFCLLSVFLCLRSLHRALKLSKETVEFFSFYHGKTIPYSELVDFIDLWYIITLIGDVMVINGSFLKLQIEKENIRLSECTNCSFLLGIGYFLIFIGFLRYFRLLPNYNILLETLKRSMPHVVRYLSCVVLLFFGYCFLGWMILGPYHEKFATFSTTAENLFSDMSGDGVYDAFNLVSTDSDCIWWFARIYMYSFLFLFLYLGASLLGSVILDAYETVKYTNEHGKSPLTIVELFLATEEYELISPISPLSS